MARCIPYTRPNYCREDVFLIGSIKKLQIQWGNTKQRKQLTRKVNVKQNKKRSREDHDNLDSLQRKNKKRKADKNINFNKSFHFARKEFSDHLERSDLSEELDPPALVLNKCNSSKGTQNSENGNAVMDSDPKKQRPGVVIRIKLPLKKQKDPEPESATTNPSFSSIFFTKSSPAQAFLTDSAPCSSSQPTEPSHVQAILTEPALRTKELQPETISQPSISAPFSTPPILQERWSSGGNCTQRSERQLFRDLMINWKPPAIRRRFEADEADLDWLFATRKSQDAKPSAQICKAGVSNPSTASSLQPRATYLPEFKMYQMPYVIPF